MDVHPVYITHSGESTIGRLTMVETADRIRCPFSNGFNNACSAALSVDGFSQSPQASTGRITGIRSWSDCRSALAVIVRIVQDCTVFLCPERNKSPAEHYGFSDGGCGLRHANGEHGLRRCNVKTGNKMREILEPEKFLQSGSWCFQSIASAHAEDSRWKRDVRSQVRPF